MALPGDLAEQSFGPWELALIALYPIELAGVVVIDGLGGWLVNLAGGVPVVGGGLRGFVQGGLNGLRGWLYGQMQGSLAAYNGLTDWVAYLWNGAEQALTALPAETYAALYRLRYQELPAAINGAADHLRGLIGDAEARLRGLIVGAEHQAAAEIAQVEAGAVGLVESARAEAVSLFDTAEADLAAGLAAVESSAENLARKAEADLAQAVLGVESELGNVAREVTTQLRDLEAEAAAGVKAALGGVAAGEQAVSDLQRELAQAKAELGDAIPNFERLLAEQIDAVIHSTPYASLVAASEAGEEVLKSDVTTLVTLGAAEIRKLIGDAESIRARYGPVILASLERAVKG